jgi:hypothetical protein
MFFKDKNKHFLRINFNPKDDMSPLEALKIANFYHSHLRSINERGIKITEDYWKTISDDIKRHIEVIDLFEYY